MMKAVVFDMDGVIVDTMDMHWDASLKTFSERGLHITKEDLKKYDTMKSSEAFRQFFEGKSEREIEEMVSEKYAYLRKRAVGIRPIQGFLDFFLVVKGKYPLAVVSSSRRGFIEFILRQLGEMQAFSAIVGAEDVKEGKPSPEGYLLAAQRLEVSPEECLVIEDSIYGVMSAKKAGCKCVAVTNTYERHFLLDADLIVGSLKELSVGKAEGLFRA